MPERGAANKTSPVRALEHCLEKFLGHNSGWTENEGTPGSLPELRRQTGQSREAKAAGIYRAETPGREKATEKVSPGDVSEDPRWS